MRIAIVAAGAAVAAAAIADYAKNGLALPGPFDDYLCTPILADSAKGQWQFNLYQVSNASIIGTSGAYQWAVSACGVSPFACTSPGNPVLEVYAAAHQIWSGNPPGGNCANPATGGTSPCTNTCKPLAYGAPRHALLNPANAAAGIVTQFIGLKPAPADGGSCGWDPVTGSDIARTATIVHTCDATVPKGTVAFVSQTENPTCQYTITIKSAAACPVAADEAYPLPPPGPAIPSVDADIPFAPYLVRPSWAGQGGGTLSYDLSSLWTKGQDWTFTNSSTMYKFAFAVAGSGVSVCAPSIKEPTLNKGSVVVYTSSTAPSGKCPLINGTLVPCTPDCHVLATGPPLIYQTIPNNGRAGLTLKWSGLVLNNDESATCATDPATGIPLPSQVTVQLNCGNDPGLTISSISQSGMCSTLITASTVVACTT